MPEDSKPQKSHDRLLKEVVVIWTVNGFMAGFLIGVLIGVFGD